MESDTPTQQLVQFLSQPDAYVDRPGEVQVIETHISWVFLTAQFAFKLKKPVHFEFLDFSTAETRRRACEDEVRLNRRLAPDVYLGVVPVTKDDHGQLSLEADGEPIEWIVKMRRLPEKRALDYLIRRQNLAHSEVATLAKRLVEFIVNQPAAGITAEDYHTRLVQHCRANTDDLMPLLHSRHNSVLKRICSAQLQYAAFHSRTFNQRVRDGRIIDGHGDLRAEHIYLTPEPAVIDCVEFSAEFRQIDSLDELCFLALDCHRLGGAEVGQLVLQEYAEVSHDDFDSSLTAFYKSYRACVRAKVTALQAEQSDAETRKSLKRLVNEYVAWADHFALKLGSPMLIVVGGRMGMGKSTLAKEISQTIGAQLLQTDAIRRSIFGPSDSPAKFGQDIYSAESRYRVYHEMFARGKEALDHGLSAVLDGAFLTDELRHTAIDCARQHGARAFHVECECPRELAISRIKERAKSNQSDSEARPELFDAQSQQWEPPATDLAVVYVDTTEEAKQVARTVVAQLSKGHH